MHRDRKEICRIISDMFDNVNVDGIYPTSTAYARLEHYLQGVRAEAIGWAHADACAALDKGDDPRLQEVPDILRRAMHDLDV